MRNGRVARLVRVEAKNRRVVKNMEDCRGGHKFMIGEMETEIRRPA